MTIAQRNVVQMPEKPAAHPAAKTNTPKPRWYDWFSELFCKPASEKIAYREYEESRRNLLQCQRQREYYENMCKFENQRIKRLRKLLHLEPQ